MINQDLFLAARSNAASHARCFLTNRIIMARSLTCLDSKGSWAPIHDAESLFSNLNKAAHFKTSAKKQVR
jgi:hypothetical protein